MKMFVTLIRRHGGKDFGLLAGPDVPPHEQRAIVKDMRRKGRSHPEIAEVLSGQVELVARFSSQEDSAKKAKVAAKVAKPVKPSE